MDAAAAFAATSGVLGAAVVDGIGNHPNGPSIMTLLAQTAARVGATKGALAGVLAAAALIDDPGVDDYNPDAVLVLAISEPGESTRLGWVGDSHAYGWDGTRLRRWTTPQGMGQYLRQNSEREDLAVEHDNWIRVSLASATATNVALAEVPAGELALLLSDGLDIVPHVEIQTLVQRHQTDPQALADALVAAAREDESGYRDDATALVLLPATPAPTTEA